MKDVLGLGMRHLVENSIGNNNYEQPAQLKSQIKNKHIAIQTINKFIVTYLQDNLFLF